MSEGKEKEKLPWGLKEVAPGSIKVFRKKSNLTFKPNLMQSYL